jgi:hypothetical protein
MVWNSKEAIEIATGLRKTCEIPLTIVVRHSRKYLELKTSNIFGASFLQIALKMFPSVQPHLFTPQVCIKEA